MSIESVAVRRLNEEITNVKYFSIYHSEPRNLSPEAMGEMQKLIEESLKSGSLVLTGGILPVKNGGARVRAVGGQITVDGPYTEAKELTGGFAILQADSREGAIELTKCFLKIAGDGECELHRIEEHGGEN